MLLHRLAILFIGRMFFPFKRWCWLAKRWSTWRV